MKQIFEQGEFNRYSKTNITEATKPIMESAQFGKRKTNVFISHKHDDLEDLKGILGFLEKEYDVNVYIDSRDPSMPKETSSITAFNIREKIKKCDKFILLATNGAIESKWCNWELGYGDAIKYPNHIALFPMKPKGEYDSRYKGSEYMSIYPCISYFDGNEKYTSGGYIDSGYYVTTENKDGTLNISSLKKWLMI